MLHVPVSTMNIHVATCTIIQIHVTTLHGPVTTMNVIGGNKDINNGKMCLHVCNMGQQDVNSGMYDSNIDMDAGNMGFDGGNESGCW